MLFGLGVVLYDIQHKTTKSRPKNITNRHKPKTTSCISTQLYVIFDDSRTSINYLTIIELLFENTAILQDNNEMYINRKETRMKCIYEMYILSIARRIHDSLLHGDTREDNFQHQTSQKWMKMMSEKGMKPE